MKIIGIQLDEHGIGITYTHDHEQTPNEQITRSVYITAMGLRQYEHVAYYFRELKQDVEELVGWWEKYHSQPQSPDS